MSLRIGFDLDGTLADFASAYHDIERRFFGREGVEGGEGLEGATVEGAPVEGASDEGIESTSPSLLRRRRDGVWAAIRSTPNFWQSLAPIDPSAVRRIHDLMLRHRWDVFFITQRPETEGNTVQRQTQQWLVQQGFDLPSVIVLHGSRGAAVGALKLHYLVDDSPVNCVDVKSESDAKPILIADVSDPVITLNARRLGVMTVPNIGAAIDLLEQTSARERPDFMRQLASLIGWR